jgi:branched-chain amino acid transport system substrate-binding protein
VLVFDQLPPGFPTKKIGLTYVQAYEAKNGIGSYSTFGAHAYDAWLILSGALERALKKGGNPDDAATFRKTLRDEIEATRGLVGTHGVFTFSPTDHLGLQFTETAVMVRVVKDGSKLDWKLEQTFK